MTILHPCQSELLSPLLWPVNQVSAFSSAGTDICSEGTSQLLGDQSSAFAPSAWDEKCHLVLSPAELPLATSDFQFPPIHENTGTSLEQSSVSPSVTFNDSMRLRPSKVNKCRFISSPALSLCQFPYILSLFFISRV